LRPTAGRATGPVVELTSSTVGRDLIVQFGLSATPASFRSVIERFILLYLGTSKAPVPFGGRTREIEALNGWLHDRRDPADSDVLAGDAGSNNLLITAPAGRGKTALLIRWIEQLPADWPLVFVPVSIRYQTNQALTFYQALAARLGSILGEALSEPRQDPSAYYRVKVIDFLDRIAKEAQRCLVVIDGLDEARGWQIDTAVLPPDPPPTLKIVISARELAGDRGSRDWLSRLGWTLPSSGARTLEVQPLSRKGIEDVLEKMAFPIADLSKDVDVINELYRLTEKGDPLLLHLYVNDLLGMRGDAARLKPTDLAKLKPGFGEYFKRWLSEQRAEWREAGINVDQVFLDYILVVLASAFGPLKSRDLENLVQRLYPANRIFTADSVEPLRRFILGDGIETGYALAHPKLAVYLQQERFGGSDILGRSQRAFIEWMREVVQGLNAGTTQPSDASDYALLFYTQHLDAMPDGSALELYRELLEDGWRKAWEHCEGGFQGFQRDVELARHAFLADVERNPEHLQKPRIGLGALIRCALCLSSVRSIGLGVPGLLLAEFLRSNSVTAKQALHLAQMKDDAGRSEAIPAIIELLPQELRSEAFASIREILDPEVRCTTIIDVLQHLEKSEQAAGAKEALRMVPQLKTYEQRQALDRLQPYAPDSAWAEAVAALGRRRQEEKAKESAPSPRPPSEGREQTDRELEWSFYYALSQESERSDLSPQRMREILGLMRDGPGVHSPRILANLAPRLPEDLLDFALECIWQSKEDLFRGDALAKLAPHLPPERARRALPVALRAVSFDLKRAVTALAERLAAGGLEGELKVVLDMDDIYFRHEALGGLAPHMTPALLTTALRAVLDADAGDLRRGLSEIAPHLSKEQITEATDRVAQMAEMAERGKALAVLLPRHRELGIPLAAKDAYQIAFLIGDRMLRDLAHAALIPFLDKAGAQEAIVQLGKRSIDPVPITHKSLIPFEALTLVLTMKYLPEADRAKRSEQAAAIARDRLVNATQRATILGILASRAPPDRRKALLNETMEIANTVQRDKAALLVFLATLFPGAKGRELMQLARQAKESEPPNAEPANERINHGLLRLFAPLALAKSLPEMQAETATVLAELLQYPKDESRMVTLAAALVLSPKLPSDQVETIIREILDAVRDEKDEQTRAFLLVLLASYLPTEALKGYVKELLAIGQRAARPTLLMVLAFAQGLAGELWEANPHVAGNRIPGSPLARLGGETAVAETEVAIRDVCSWWA
jgi:hypothetical protein